MASRAVMSHNSAITSKNGNFMASNSPAAAPLSPAGFVSSAALFLFFWASGFVAAKYGFPYAEPFTFLALRFCIGSLALFAIALASGATWPKTGRQLLHIMAAGMGVQSLYLVGVYYGIYLGVSTGVIALIVGLQPLLTGALAGPFLGERVNRRQWVGLVLGFIGLALVVSEKVAGGKVLWGFAFGGLGLIAITLGTLYQKRFCANMDIRSSVAIQNTGSLVLMTALAFIFESRTVHWTGEFVFALLWSAVGLSVIAITLYYRLVRSGAAARVTSLIYLSPPTTAVMGYLAFGEMLGGLALVGMGVAAVGVWLANRG